MPTIEFFNTAALEAVVFASTVVADGFLALVVYRSNPKSATNRIFLLLTLCTVFWLEATYMVRSPELFPLSLILHRLGIFFAAPMSLLFFLLAHTMPSEKIILPKKMLYLSVGATLLMMLCNISPYAFSSVTLTHGVSVPQAGLGIIPFSIISTIFSVLTFYFLIHSYRRSQGVVKKQAGLMLAGILLMLGFIILTILIPIIVLHSTAFLPYTSLYVLFFLALTAYAITKYQLFNIKVLLTQTLIVLIDIVLFSKLFGDTTTSARLLDALVLVFMVVVGFFLVRSVKNEVRQRELIETQEKELEVTNARLRDLDQQKNEFLSFASHQLRTPLTAIKWSAGAILDESTGKISDELRDLIKTIFDESSLMALFINDYLNVSRIEQGKMEYRYIPTNLVEVIRSTAKQMEPGVKQKGLTLHTDVVEDTIMVWADASKLTQVISNLIDNAMKYTPKGEIKMSVRKLPNEKKAQIVIQDTGIGMDKETLGKVFDKFVRGENAKEVNGAGSGLGLFIVKTFVEAHKGVIRIDSEGIGKGTKFTIEFPILVQTPAAQTTQITPAATV